MRKVLESLHQGICILDQDSKIKFVNKAFSDQVHLSQEDIENKQKDEAFRFTDDRKYLIIKDEYGCVDHLSIKYIDEFFEGEQVKYMIIEECQYKQERDLFEEYFNRLPFLAGIKDKEGRYLFINNQCVEMSQAFSDANTRHEILGKTDLELWNIQYGLQLREKEEKVIQNKQPITYDEEAIIGRERVHFHVNKNYIPDVEGNVKYLIGTKIDRSYEYKMEKQLKKSYEQMSTLKSILNDADNALVVLDNVKQEMMQQLNAEYISILTYDQKNGIVGSRIKYGSKYWREEEDFKGVKISWADIEDKQFWGLKHIDEVECNNSKKERCERYDLRISGITYEAAYPLVYQEEILGILSFGYKDAIHIPKDLDSFIDALVRQISVLLKNASLAEMIKNVLRENNLTKEEMHCIINNGVDVIGIINPDGKVRKVNRGYSQVLGWQEEEIVGEDCDKLVYSSDILLFKKWAKRCLRQEDVEPFTCRIKCIDGAYKWIQWKAKILEENNLIIAMGRNVTKERELEEAKLEYEKALQMETLKNEFFANLSHEFKTPINIVLSMMQLMGKNIEDGSIQYNKDINLDKHIKIVKQNAYRLLRLVNNLIDMTRIDAGYYKVNFENHNIISVIEEITMSVAEYIEDKGISLIFDTEEEEVILACDPDKIERIMLNLLSNAVKAMASDNHLERKLEIEVYIAVKNENVYVSVKDNGIGIPKEKLQDIFTRFVQIEDNVTRKTEGSGIGLALVKSLVEMHGGQIDVESEGGIGTSFCLSLPIKRVVEVNDTVNPTISNKIEKCVIEFSDVYSIH